MPSHDANDAHDHIEFKVGKQKRERVRERGRTKKQSASLQISAGRERRQADRTMAMVACIIYGGSHLNSSVLMDGARECVSTWG